jgi:hypothetical protein
MISRRTFLNSFLNSFLNLLWILCLVLLTTLSGGEAIAMGGEQPPLDQPAPEFTLPTNSGDGKISLSEDLPKKRGAIAPLYQTYVSTSNRYKQKNFLI